MVEILIKAVDATHKDPIKDKRGCYKRGDPVVVMPNGWSWGKEELNKDKFYILRVKDMTLKQGKELILPDVDTTDIENPIIVRKRKYSIKVDNLPGEVKDKLSKQIVDTTVNELNLVTVTKK